MVMLPWLLLLCSGVVPQWVPPQVPAWLPQCVLLVRRLLLLMPGPSGVSKPLLPTGRPALPLLVLQRIAGLQLLLLLLVLLQSSRRVSWWVLLQWPVRLSQCVM